MTPNSSQSPRVWTIVPAAGVGARMRADRPKPYLRLGDRFLIDLTLERLLKVGRIDTIYLALHPDDRWWGNTESASNGRIVPFTGGAERDDSVRAGLDQFRGRASPLDWVLVHDVARPCVREADIDSLLDELAENRVGGLLGAPLTDTIKEVGADGAVKATADRSRLWRALTPQVFRFEVLDRALQSARENSAKITDEASAVELLGLQPRLVAGCADNIKVTVPEDLALAAWILRGH
ncbi:2-C-methyl-D-erythritol 4-phosphate cytidylyltransferase [Hydrocarboniclastica marina]|uniref:2-C-methyl-D-erythritol 4-phosphate cytidylyltransferase n=1 Tax=Hydrocarboniclastica marina TaxID=2259620 RepID=A0A4P7XKC2_9ALTE|nr:2-C-methyl-D-erythritol 4-phosphate cytidylyltransferase [Hydrocarboniclastica marina]MAL98901.1 2-C-methyl-D-erythritol 4-phosphate cytidylyltransferase [Alteromonadaceae bacterium]QCF26377.1 2-C-methyl-D-erythritol 4-phosphate cytidylyltransferase [Hydrocarboniclastica marina]